MLLTFLQNYFILFIFFPRKSNQTSVTILILINLSPKFQQSKSKPRSPSQLIFQPRISAIFLHLIANSSDEKKHLHHTQSSISSLKSFHSSNHFDQNTHCKPTISRTYSQPHYNSSESTIIQKPKPIRNSFPFPSSTITITTSPRGVA